jgi:protein TonB
MGFHMTCADHNRFLLPAWSISLALHGVAIALAVVFAAQVRPVLQEEPFKWEVALVDAVKTDSIPAPTAVPESAPPQAPARAAAPRPVEPMETVMHRVAPRESVQMVHPEVQPPTPTTHVEEPLRLPKSEPAPVAEPPQERIVEPILERTAEAPPMNSEPVMAAKEPERVQTPEPAMTQQQPVAVPPSYEAVETRPAETPSKPSMPEPVASSSPEPAPVLPSPPSTVTAEAPVQVAKAAPSGHEVKTDHRWLAESLWRRVAELKRYPSSARLNGQEGKVILKAVIRSDGQLAEVSVQKSSGHHILDAAAMEAVKLACPLHMKHAISKPEIIVNLPIVYSLAN